MHNGTAQGDLSDIDDGDWKGPVADSSEVVRWTVGCGWS